ncbi:MAG: hypothetical protein K2K73_02315 [Ureaplasma sp.]|nr:hypothetical protein [Ureaplasma sp.]
MNTSPNKQSFIKSKTFIICTFAILAAIFFILFLNSVINMGIRYNFFREVLERNESETYPKIIEAENVWRIFLASQNSWKLGVESISGEIITLKDTTIQELISKYPNVSLNLGYTIMTIVFVFAFVICVFVPLACWMGILSKKKAEKKLMKKQAKLQKLSQIKE